jgi:DNA topoisomerase VI subunit B
MHGFWGALSRGEGWKITDFTDYTDALGEVVAMSAARLNRKTFSTSRLLEFCTEKELTLQTGHPVEQWPLVILKELFDNALDAAEELGVPPQIKVVVDTDAKSASITISDNAGGILASTVEKLLDFSVRVSSREAYASPTRGAQGNALKTIIAMPFVLDGTNGETIIEAQGTLHRIIFSVDAIRQQPKIEYCTEPSKVKNGTCITLKWPELACSHLDEARSRFLLIAYEYAWLNPHLSLEITWDGERQTMTATEPAWAKWGPSEPTSAHWYDLERFERLAAANVADDQDNKTSRTVWEFIAEFRGLSGSAKRKQVLDASGTSRMPLADLFKDGNADHVTIARLLQAMKNATKPVKPHDLGIIGKDHLASRFAASGANLETFNYKCTPCVDANGIPAVIEVAFAYCPSDEEETFRLFIAGVNWSRCINNPFRLLGVSGESLESYLQEQRAGHDEPIILAVHLASPCIVYTDRGKSALALNDQFASAIIDDLRIVTKAWAKQRKREERERSARANRATRLIRSQRESIKDVVYEVMEAAYMHASDGGQFSVTATQIMYAARPKVQERTGEQLDRQYFNQTLLPNFRFENPDVTADWDIAYDERGHFTEPHTGYTFGVGTFNVRDYLSKVHKLKMQEAALAPAQIITCGPHGEYGGLFYTEKEGFRPLWEQVRLAERFDIAMFSNKGLSVTASRELADEICHAYKIPLIVLHDFDKAGFSIKASFERRQSRRYTFQNRIKIIDLGLRLDDISGLAGEDVFDRGSEQSRAANLRLNGATEEEVEFLLQRRVELNAMTSLQLVAFVEGKLRQHGIGKVVPKPTELANAYRLFLHGHEVERIFQRELKKLNGSFKKAPVPPDLEHRVRDYLQEHPDTRWDKAVAAIVEDDKPPETNLLPKPDDAA